jgi:hypothetical protein
MNCPHCANWHAPGTLFCPETGKPIPQAAGLHVDRGAAGGSLTPAGFSGTPQHVEPIGIGELLQKAFEVYKTHFLALFITCAIALVPVGLATGFIQYGMLHGGAMSGMQQTGDRMQQRSKEVEKLQKQLAAASDDEKAEIAENLQKANRDLAREATAALKQTGGMLAQVGMYLLLALLLIPLQVIAHYLAQAALIPIIGDRALGGQMAPQQAWTRALRKLVPLVVTSILAGIATGIGMIACILPGLILVFLFAFAAPVVLLEGRSAVDALKRSATLVRNHWLNTLIISIVLGVIIFGVVWIAGRLPGVGGPIVLPFLQAALMPFYTVAMVLLYLDLRRVDEGLTEADLQRQMTGQ